MLRILVRSKIAVVLVFGLIASGFAQPNVTITVTKEKMQEFLGMGFSVHKARGYFFPSNSANLNKLYSGTFSGMNSITFWSYIENPEHRDRLITTASDHGLKHIMVNPIGEPKTTEEHAINVFNEVDEYMKAGYPIYGTTIMNKPNTNESGTLRMDPAFLAECAKRIRFKLDSAGYTQVKIGGPSTIEWSPYMDPVPGGAAHGYGFEDGDNMMYLQAFLNDPEALAVLDAFDFQSYGWSASKEIQQLADTHQKELWVTLSATDGHNNNNGDPILAGISAATVLANINHGVKYWSHWVWDQLVDFGSGTINTRMKYLQEIGKNFPSGAVVRRCTADEDQVSTDMAWNYYDFDNPANSRQPEIVAAASMNADSTMTIAVVNLSGIRAQHFFSEFKGENAETYTVNLRIEEMSGLSSVNATPMFCHSNGEIETAQDVEIREGELQIDLPAKDLLIIRTDVLRESVVTGVSARENEKLQELTVYPNPFEDEINIRAKMKAGIVNIQVRNLQGMLICKTEDINHAGGEYHHQINLDNISGGVYLVELTSLTHDGRNQIQRIKLVKQ